MTGGTAKQERTEAQKAADVRRQQAKNETAARHAQMRARVRELHIQPTSQAKRDWLRRLFDEARWTYNWYLEQLKGGKKLSQIDTKDTHVLVLTPNGYEVRELFCLSSEMRQSVKDSIGASLKSIKTNIANKNIGHAELHYKQSADSIRLSAGGWRGGSKRKQTFQLYRNRRRFNLQGFAKHPFQEKTPDAPLFKVSGGKQIPENAEIADGKIVRRAGEYYLQVTYYEPWEGGATTSDVEQKSIEAASALNGVGLDFGITRQIVDSEGNDWSWCFKETETLKKAQAANERYRAWHKKTYGWARSSNKQLRIIARENEKLRRRKQDAINKFCAALQARAGFIAVQDEQIKAWHADERYSEIVQHSILGGVMARLKKQPTTHSISKWTRTTSVCPDCGHVLEEKLELDERTWDCPCCGAHHDRDIASARAVLTLCACAALYPSCPAALDDDVWVKMLGVLGLDKPVPECDCLDQVG